MIAGVRRTLRSLLRDWRSGDLRVMAIALIIGVGAVTSVGAFTDRLQQGLRIQGSELLAADLVVRLAQPPAEQWQTRADELGLSQARTMTFRSVALHGERSGLTEVKAVTAAYPLRGRLRTAAAPGMAETVVDGVPPPGTVWVEPRVLGELEAAVGDTLRLGRHGLRIDAVLTYEPDRGGEVFAIAPRVLMNEADVAATELIAPGSLVSHRWLLAGDPIALGQLREWVAQEADGGARFQTLDDAQPRFRAALERGERFLGLAALASMLLAGVAVARGAHRYAERRVDEVALMRCLGAGQRAIVTGLMAQLAIFGVIAGSLGAVLGYLAQYGLVALLPGLSAGVLPPPGLVPAMAGVSVGVVALLGFALPAVLRLREVSPLRVLRRDLGPLPLRIWPVYGAAVASVGLLVAWVARDPALAMWAFAGALVTVFVLAIAALGLASGLRRLGGGVAWRLGALRMARRRGDAVAQMVAVGLGLMAMLLLGFVRADLLEGWRDTLPPGTPNHFLINIQADQRDALTDFFADNELEAPEFVPLLRARLVAINGEPPVAEAFEDEFARRQIQREANLSWAADPGPDNRVVSGRWWTPERHGEPLLSLEASYAERLGLGIGDELTYRIGGEDVTLVVDNLRYVAWDSFRPNFFVVAPPRTLESFASMFITSLFLPRDDETTVRQLIEEFPNVTDIDVGATLDQVRTLMDRVNLALAYVFLFTVAAGIAVLVAAIHAGEGERRSETALLRTLGARRRQVLNAVITEFSVLGAIAGVLGAGGAAVAGWALATFVLDLSYRPDPLMWIAGVIAGIVIAVGVGVASTRAVLRSPPWLTLSRG